MGEGGSVLWNAWDSEDPLELVTLQRKTHMRVTNTRVNNIAL